MLTKEDLKEIRSVVKDVVPGIVQDTVPAIVQDTVPSIVQDVVRKEFVDMESRLEKKITENVSSRVVSDVGEMLEQNVLPQFDEIRRDLRFIRAQMVTRVDLEDRLADFRVALKGSIS